MRRDFIGLIKKQVEKNEKVGENAEEIRDDLRVKKKKKLYYVN